MMVSIEISLHKDAVSRSGCWGISGRNIGVRVGHLDSVTTHAYNSRCTSTSHSKIPINVPNTQQFTIPRKKESISFTDLRNDLLEWKQIGGSSRMEADLEQLADDERDAISDDLGWKRIGRRQISHTKQIRSILNGS